MIGLCLGMAGVVWASLPTPAFTLAWNHTAGELHVVSQGEPATLAYDALILCAGATDRLMPVPGWHRAGCYSLGASQIALKAQACAIGSQVVFMGSGPLLYLVASQYVQAGAKVVAVLDTAPASKPWKAITGLLARPTLAAIEGLPSEFFSGTNLSAGVVSTSQQGGTTKRGAQRAAQEGGLHRLVSWF